MRIESIPILCNADLLLGEAAVESLDRMSAVPQKVAFDAFAASGRIFLNRLTSRLHLSRTACPTLLFCSPTTITTRDRSKGHIEQRRELRRADSAHSFHASLPVNAIGLLVTFSTTRTSLLLAAPHSRLC